MKTVFDLAVPRAQVLQGELRPELFAARLKDVVDRTADPVYRDPDLFFENTYPTAGLRTLLREVLGRLAGQSPTNSPIIRLETSFGGGKTHNLIALYHAVGGKCPPACLRAFAGEGVEAISYGIRQMPLEEVYYWYSKCTDADAADRAQRALRILLAAE